MTAVVFQSYTDAPNRGYWDQAMLEELFRGELWGSADYETYNSFEELPEGTTGAIVVLPARYHVGHVTQINNDLARLEWVIVILASDEEGLFPVAELQHPRMLVYLMTPHPEKDASADRYLGEYYPTGTREILRGYAEQAAERPNHWFFAGQVTHERREQCVDACKHMNNSTVKGVLVETPGFTQGLEREEYLRQMASAKVVLCPSGPATPDSFRLYEALEAGCIPLADDCTPGTKPLGYWKRLMGDVPFPVIRDWDTVPALIDNLKDRPEQANYVYAWWQAYKRELWWNLRDDVSHLAGQTLGGGDPNELITVLISTSPVSRHPDTSILDETLASVRAQLPTAEVLIMCDGVRDEQAVYRRRYWEYLRRVLWNANFEQHNVLPVLYHEHHHQARMTRETLNRVRTPFVLFVEHDTPICEEIPWREFCTAIHAEELNMIRLLHEAYILDPYQHMMLDREPVTIAGIPIVRTVQWSQRPHLASTEWYRDLLRNNFTDDSITMIEDKMHGVVHNAWLTRGKAGWNQYKIGIYAPPGDMKRSLHTDGRGMDPKYDMRF